MSPLSPLPSDRRVADAAAGGMSARARWRRPAPLRPGGLLLGAVLLGGSIAAPLLSVRPRRAQAQPVGAPRLRAARGARGAEAGAAGLVQTERYRVSASVGGVARGNLRDIGRAVVRHVSLPGGRFRVTGGAQVENRDRRKLYRFSVDMTFGAQGRRLTVVESRNRFNPAGEEIRVQVERAVPFLSLLRTLPIPLPAEEPARSFLAPHGYFVLRYARTEARAEVSLHCDDELVGRFVLIPRAAPEAHVIERITIEARGGVTVTLSRTS
jgi:hypothetical protein